MNQTPFIALLLISLLTGCDKPKPVTELTCQDNPQRRMKASQTAIAEACFRQGQFKPSTKREW